MGNAKRGSVYTRSITLDHTHPRQVEKTTVCLKRCIMYTQTQNAYAGNQTEQTFQMEATDVCSAKCLRLTDIDLSTLWVKAAVSGAIIHIFGTICELEEYKEKTVNSIETLVDKE